MNYSPQSIGECLWSVGGSGGLTTNCYESAVVSLSSSAYRVGVHQLVIPLLSSTSLFATRDLRCVTLWPIFK